MRFQWLLTSRPVVLLGEDFGLNAWSRLSGFMRSIVSVAEGTRQNLDNQKKIFIEHFFSTVQLVRRVWLLKKYANKNIFPAERTLPSFSSLTSLGGDFHNRSCALAEAKGGIGIGS